MLMSSLLPVGNDSNLLIVFYVQIMPDDVKAGEYTGALSFVVTYQ